MELDNLIEIEPYLPHRKPMLMVDAIVEISAERVVCVFKIEKECVFVQNNQLQEAGLIEHMAQTCSSIMGQTYFENKQTDSSRPIGFISAIKSLTINHLPEVGKLMRTESVLENKFYGDDYTLSTMLVNVVVDNEVIAEGTINLFLQENRNEKI
ncbi:hypothetical protein [Sphingobacterium hungaricum]